MPGVKHVVQITDGVAVVADSWWQAKNARDASSSMGRGRRTGAQRPKRCSTASAQAAAASPAPIKKQGDVDAGCKGAARRS